ncbi:MAG: hypothetical protein LUO93_12255 [Methanomicrobiales archaeon]|nr:hypothetical protein [Methanomicrobiales archaeon]
MKQRLHLLILPLVLTILLLLTAGCTSTPGYGTPTPTTSPIVTTTMTTPPATTPSGTATVMTASSSKGTILIDSRGITLYYFGTDIPGSGTSACTSSSCTALWPPFSPASVVVNAPLVASDFQTVTRSDGMKQTTYRGWPLYYYQSDHTAGDVNGDGVLGIWYVMSPDYTVVIMKNTNVGTYLADGMGKTLYVFRNDMTGMSACTGTCIQTWPVFLSTNVIVPSGLTGSDFAVIQRTDGTSQSIHKGMPLYYYSGDSNPGDTRGQGIGGVWFVAPLGNLPQITATTTTRPSGGGGGYGY